ncbi:MAG: bifunctional phosphopantothenoylcysteine decarboxylase/phosphopantothenate--cysteine ligase CoaBC [Actinobacteria bacterium HGW-Actinobacteria-7]|jgi:phosphopantothenoylcysteine decarboxylase/phosphopantothenate--cysteine ligase|nr:MAG: bifunctional phosphopantothenoylcysteine decarboxylase/phosphopantothenate--cysteine ligase CoaBC [Actinobacteria bacterium HGW-Actinobacteria-7]
MTTAKTPTVLLGVTGCIAAYKACELARELMRSGCRVKVVMTDNATRFVGPTTFRALTGEPVAVSLWDEPSARVHHISLAQEADVLVVAPATANFIAKLAHGRADDLLSTVALATQAPTIVAPAMNVAMWQSDATRDNVAALTARDVTVISPTAGDLACGDTGEGRLAEVHDIADEVLAQVRRTRDLEGVRVLVTAGPTHEMIDPVRFIGNASSGKSGFAIAAEARARGAHVTLVSGPTTLPNPAGVDAIRVVSALEMAAAVSSVYESTDVVVATAAVSDFRPLATSPQKLKKDSAALTIELVRNPDILASLGNDKGGRLLVGFAAETTDVVAHAHAKVTAKNLDLVVANDVSDSSLGFGTDDNVVWFVAHESQEELCRMPKRMIARALWDRIASDARAATAKRTKGDLA